MIENPCEWGTAAFLIFSDNVGSLIYYTHIFPLLISLFLGFQVLINNPRGLANRVLFFVTVMFSIWVYFDLILWASPTPESVMFFWSAIVPIEMLFYLGSLYLVYLFSTNQNDAPLWLKVVAALPLIPVFLFVHTNLNVVGLLPDCDEGALEGPLIQYMYIVEFIVILIICGIVFRGLRTLTDGARQQLKVIGFGTIISLLIFSAGNLALVFSLGAIYEQYKLFGMPVFAALVTYTIVKYRAFHVKTLLVEILITSLWILLFSVILFRDIDNIRIAVIVTLIIFGFLGIMLSQSVRKEVEQRQEIEQLAKRLEAANKRLRILDQMKSEFVSIASHQLRSPLTSIRGYASMLLEGSYGKLSGKAQEAIERISEASRYMALSVEDYLNVSRIQSGNMKYVKSDFNLYDLANSIADDMRGEAVKRGLVLTCRSDMESKGIVNADIGKTRQIVQNLVDNAMKYTPKGSITILIRDQKRPKRIFIDVIDTGIGMEPEIIENLFDKFERADNAKTVNVTGTGLGLYIAQKMAQDMGGDVSAHSEGEGKGSRFTFELPLQM